VSPYPPRTDPYEFKATKACRVLSGQEGKGKRNIQGQMGRGKRKGKGKRE